MVLSAVSAQSLPAWVCFVIGVALILIGVATGLVKYFTRPSPDEVEQAVSAAKAQVSLLGDQAVASATTAQVDHIAARSSSSMADEVNARIDALASLVSAFPAELRFPVFLIVIGGLLMSVATIQFGGHPVL